VKKIQIFLLFAIEMAVLRGVWQKKKAIVLLELIGGSFLYGNFKNYS